MFNILLPAFKPLVKPQIDRLVSLNSLYWLSLGPSVNSSRPSLFQLIFSWHYISMVTQTFNFCFSACMTISWAEIWSKPTQPKRHIDWIVWQGSLNFWLNPTHSQKAFIFKLQTASRQDNKVPVSVDYFFILNFF